MEETNLIEKYQNIIIEKVKKIKDLKLLIKIYTLINHS